MARDNFNLGEITIGKTEMPLIIPEIGINHEGSLKTAKEMVLSAKRAGAKIIKHQTHVIDDEMSHVAKKVIPGNATVSIYDIMKRCALSEDDEYELKRYTESLGLIYLSTPFSRAAANRLEDFSVLAYKIGSGEMNNYPLLEHIAAFGKPMIVSTGMNNMKSIKKAVAILDKYSVDYALMHTTNLYPTPPHLVRLNAMMQMIEQFTNIPIGLSDHTQNNNAAKAALALGACIIERHYTDNKERTGPDIVCSMDELEATDLINSAKEIFLMRGGNKCAAEEEQITIDFAFATIVTIKKIFKGEPFTKENVWVKRPGKGGILAEHYSTVLNKTATCDIPIDTHLTWEVIN